MMATEWEEIGIIGVDAGLCWVGDPCYCVTPDCSSHPAPTWSGFCEQLSKQDAEAGEHKGVYPFNYPLGHAGLGVAVSTGWGDGSYPVFIRRDPETGRIAAVMVQFME